MKHPYRSRYTTTGSPVPPSQGTQERYTRGGYRKWRALQVEGTASRGQRTSGGTQDLVREYAQMVPTRASRGETPVTELLYEIWWVIVNSGEKGATLNLGSNGLE